MEGSRFLSLSFTVLSLTFSLLAQSQPVASEAESFKVYTDHPRLLLPANRLRLLKRERARQSLRWTQFDTLMAGKAPMPEQGFASALYYKIAENKEAGRQAIAWALGPAGDLRQLALVFDWCRDLLSDSQSKALAAKLQKGIAAASRDQSVPAVRSRLLAAIALAGEPGFAYEGQIESLVRTWWEGRIVPSLKEGRNVIRREDTYALYEMLHVMRDNFNVDLRDSARAFFKLLPIYHLVSYYPATYPAPENEYRIPATKGAGEPDLYRAALSRATELSMVSYDNNAPESQVLQGWLMHDNFLMRGTFGAPYEFFWANPYQPGLSYYLVPLVFHDNVSGRLFIRSTWDESATWLGFFDGQLQLFQDGKVTILNPQLSSPPIELEPAVVLFGQSSQKFKIDLKEDEELFVLGLKPSRLYAIEIDDEEMTEGRTDPGGILALNLPRKVAIGVRLHEESESRVAQPVQEPAK